MARRCHRRGGPASGRFSEFSCTCPCRSSPWNVAGVNHFGSQRYFSLLSKRDVALTQFSRNVRSTQPRTLLVVIMYVRLSCLSATQMFQLPSLITMAIAATRMYRSLTDFGSGSADMYGIPSFLFSRSPVLVVDDGSSAHLTSSSRIRIQNCRRYSGTEPHATNLR